VLASSLCTRSTSADFCRSVGSTPRSLKPWCSELLVEPAAQLRTLMVFAGEEMPAQLSLSLMACTTWEMWLFQPRRLVSCVCNVQHKTLLCPPAGPCSCSLVCTRPALLQGSRGLFLPRLGAWGSNVHSKGIAPSDVIAPFTCPSLLDNKGRLHSESASRCE